MDRNISVRDVPFVNPRRRLCQIRRHPQHQCQGVLTSLVGALTAPLTAGAQQAGKPTIGILDLGSAAGMRRWDALREGLRDLGHVEGQTLAIEYRSAEDQTSRLPVLVAELVALKVKVIVTTGTTSIRAAKDATNSVRQWREPRLPRSSCRARTRGIPYS